MRRSFPYRFLGWFLVLSFLVSCGGDEPVDPTPVTPVTPVDPNPPKPPQDNKAPTITVSQNSVNVITGPSVTVSGEELKIGDVSVASWKDDVSSTCTVVLTLTLKEGPVKTINSWDKLSEEGQLQLKVADEAGNSSTRDIALTATAVFGLENLARLQLQVDQEADLMNGLTFAEGLTLQKVEAVMDNVHTEIPDPKVFIPEFPGSVSIILTLARPDGSTIEIKVDNLTVNALAYSKLTVTDLKPVDILPIIGQIEAGDKNVYSHIEHLWVAEATRIRDMMWEYGAGSHSAVEYQELMNRLNTGMLFEIPKWYDNYEMIGWQLADLKPSSHAASLWSILITLLNHANLCVDVPPSSIGTWWAALMDRIDKSPNSINIYGSSAWSTAQDTRSYEAMYATDGIKSLSESKNFIVFAAGTNVNGSKNSVYNDEYEVDEHWVYYLASLANSDKNNHPERHVMVTIATNKTGDIDQTGVMIESSKFPIGFANNILFSGRGFPHHREGKLYWPSGRYTTSDTNYFNVALTSICFQLFAEVADVDQLLEMIRATCLTDYIHLDLNEDGDTNDTYDGHPETVPLQLINPAGFYKKYLTPNTIPSSVSLGETTELQKGYYKGVVFNIPGAEVMIGDEWIPFDSKNKDAILSQNPMNLTWRINGNLLKKMGYTAGQTIEGQIITVDDQWNGLRLEVPMTITIN